MIFREAGRHDIRLGRRIMIFVWTEQRIRIAAYFFAAFVALC